MDGKIDLIPCDIFSKSKGNNKMNVWTVRQQQLCFVCGPTRTLLFCLKVKTWQPNIITTQIAVQPAVGLVYHV